MQLIGLWQKALVEFKLSEVISLVASKWSVLMEKDSVHVALTIGDKQTWVSRDQHWALLYTLPVGTTAHDLSGLLDLYGGKICVIGHNPVISVPIFKGVSLHWAGLSLACCAMCKHFGHVSNMCSVGGNSERHDKRVITPQDQAHLASIYKRRQAPIARPVSFGGKTWAQVAGGSLSRVVFLVVSGTKLSLDVKILSIGSDSLIVTGLNDHLASLKHSLELLADQVSDILKRLSSVELVPLPLALLASPPVVFALLDLSADSNMVLDAPQVSSFSLVTVINNAASDFGSNSSKILTAKVGGLELKMMALDATVVGFIIYPFISMSGLVWKIVTCNVRGMNNPAKQDNIICWHNDMNNLISIFMETKLKERVHIWIVNKFDGVRVFISGLDSGYLDAGVVIVVNSSLVRHVYKVSEVFGWLLSIKLLFKNKLLVLVLGLYTSALLVVWFSQAGEVNSLITKAVNKSSFIILGGNFNKDGLCKSVSFTKCLNLGLVNSLMGSPVVKSPTWENSRDVKKTIDFVFVSLCLVNAIMYCNVLEVGEHYDTDYWAVSVSIGLGGLLDAQLNSLHKQANKDYWKFNFKGPDEIRWNNFRDATLANATMFSDEFATFVRFSDLDAMWDVVRKILVLSASEVFKKKWFKNFDNVFTKVFSRFHKLELLVSKILKASREECVAKFESFIEYWVSLDDDRTSVVQSVVNSDAGANGVCSALFSARRYYHAFKLTESLRAKEANIKSTINKRIESFEVDKGYTIRSMLERPLCKMVLNHLVMGNELVLEPDLVKSKVDDIMEEWTRKHVVVDDVSDIWSHQY
ncbi:hypothetical protein G9A89_000654 [Geosiphon pyriformis]|nr:hypothetical protein G9A89_000654 [Geosiphon pyriformis]